MKIDEWNPGHTPHQGYPHNEIVSKRITPNRANFYKNKEGKIAVDIDREIFPDTETADQLLDFLFFHNFNLQEALKLAEEQIEAILKEDPFFPDRMGFELVVKPQDTTEAPVRMYVSKFDPSFSLFRTPGAEILSSYTLLKKNPDQTFTQTVINLPTARIAYATLFALGVVMTQEQLDAAAEKKRIKEYLAARKQFINDQEELKTSHRIIFERSEMLGNSYATHRRCVDVNADDEKDAQSKAKFIIETDTEATTPISDVKFEEMMVITRSE